MNCPRCGEVCGCHTEPAPAAATVAPAAAIDEPSPAGSTGVNSLDQTFAGEPGASVWRDEISARLSRYRSRRKMHPPRYPSLSLPFVPAESPARDDPADTGSALPAFEPIADQALALDVAKTQTTNFPDPALSQELSARLVQPPASASGSSGAKILEFPRFAWGPPSCPADQLADPVSERPRILEVPEIAPSPPALGGITIEAAESQEPESRPGIDIPVESGSLARRIFAGAIDGFIIAAASALFGVIFWRVTTIRPPRIQMIGLAAVVPCVLWAAYQYLLIVYGASTPGLRAAGLELVRFEDTSTVRSLRRWRVLAAWLSAASLGMGYIWVLLDEDTLCWHDRITRTYLAPRKRPTGNGIGR